MAIIDNKINSIIDDYEPKLDIKRGNKRRAVSILNEIRNSLPDSYLNHGTTFKMKRRYQAQKLDKTLSKYSKQQQIK